MSYPEAFSLIPKYNYLYSCLALTCKLIAVFTPLSIRRGDGGEAVDRRLFGYVFYVKDGDIQIFFLPLQHITIDGLFSKPQ